ncbi:hypothetical protein DASC09_025070 [Saccharomycopsis crataegensis]|uniref:Uncharacterized protein n=1 Tax=Saccharomycopsis crataegensis TaxID=43959 RepID=A0AAV5QKV5_9ASCO|nr:hypothetical protein DASC09_025070 [Saccharomycopsis crataegensis]
MSRALEIDIFRGLNILEMENTESCDDSFFDHASYDDMKMNYADTIFPCFSFISGMLLKRDKVVPARKSIQLIGLGMAFNSVPMLLENEKFRPLGVLQRHGLSSIILNNLVPINFRNSVLFPLAMSGLWLAVSFGHATDKSKPFDNQEHTAQQKIDSIFFGGRTYHENFDPEGLLGSFMTSVTIWSGYWFMQQNLSNLHSFLAGAGFLGAGYLVSKVFPAHFPVSKPLWTPAFALTSNGWSILKYLAVKNAIPYLPSLVKNLLAIVGKQSMEVYFLGEILLLISKYEFTENTSIWKMAQSGLNKIFSSAITKTILTLTFDISLVGFAYWCNANGWKIRLL